MMKDIDKKSTSFFASDEERIKGLNSIKPNLNLFSRQCDIKEKVMSKLPKEYHEIVKKILDLNLQILNKLLVKFK